MKKFFSIFAISAVFAACNSNPKTVSDTANNATTADTATLNQNAFTDKAREVQLNGVNDTIVTNNGETYVKVNPDEAKPVTVNPAVASNTKPAVRRTTKRTSKASSGGSGTGTTKSESSTVSNGTSGSNGSGADTTTTSTTTTQKKGWSKAAKGTVIGAGTGAAAGAIISKKKGKGAIVGGIIGATGGYIIGRSKDKKDGRY